MIYIKNTQKKIPINIKYLKDNSLKILEILNYANFDLNIWITTNKTIKKYNNQFRNKNKITDVLSFPFYPSLRPGEVILPEYPDENILGDIIISAEYCYNHTLDQNLDFNNYTTRIIVHGIAHLLGYDHIKYNDYKKMIALERKLLKNLNIDMDI